MNWEKKGLVFDANNFFDWAIDTSLQPTPLILSDRIRVFIGGRDKEGVSRIGFVDFDKNDPSKVIDFSKKPCLDIGEDGCFDDNGVVPSAVIKRDNKVFLYYAGYQLVKKVRFIVLCGLAISDDNGLTFKRFKKTPILERTENELLFRVIHSVLFEDNTWKIWYGGGSHFIQGKNKSLPVYDIRYMESKDGINFPDQGKAVLENEESEHRVGRPYVIKLENKFQMFFGASTEKEPYRLAYAESEDGINWRRINDFFGFEYNELEFDSNMSAYPGVVILNDKTYIFYNGNEYGKYGIGLAISI